jgi:hypothetical protein
MNKNESGTITNYITFYLFSAYHQRTKLYYLPRFGNVCHKVYQNVVPYHRRVTYCAITAERFSRITEPLMGELTETKVTGTLSAGFTSLLISCNLVLT